MYDIISFIGHFVLNFAWQTSSSCPKPVRATIASYKTDTGCLIKNASTHNFFIYYPISMNKKTEDMVFHALRSSHKILFFLA
jgi:hypothetical protein